MLIKVKNLMDLMFVSVVDPSLHIWFLLNVQSLYTPTSGYGMTWDDMRRGLWTPGGFWLVVIDKMHLYLPQKVGPVGDLGIPNFLHI